MKSNGQTIEGKKFKGFAVLKMSQTFLKPVDATYHFHLHPLVLAGLTKRWKSKCYASVRARSFARQIQEACGKEQRQTSCWKLKLNETEMWARRYFYTVLLWGEKLVYCWNGNLKARRMFLACFHASFGPSMQKPLKLAFSSMFSSNVGSVTWEDSQILPSRAPVWVQH